MHLMAQATSPFSRTGLELSLADALDGKGKGNGQNSERPDSNHSNPSSVWFLPVRFSEEFSGISYCRGQIRRSTGRLQGPAVRAPEPPVRLRSGVTSLRIQNIPYHFAVEDVLSEMFLVGYEGAMDFFYLPIDFHSKKNKGYAFINLRSWPLACAFAATLHGLVLDSSDPYHHLVVSQADMQGFQAVAECHLKRGKRRVGNPWFRPMIFVPGETSFAPWRCLPLSRKNLDLALELRNTTSLLDLDSYFNSAECDLECEGRAGDPAGHSSSDFEPWHPLAS